jgi:hypothetical protein
MCQSLQTKAGQEWIPDFLKDTSGTTVTVPERGQHNRNAVDRPLRADDVNELAIERRREQLRRQYDENPGSIKPSGALTRKDIMEEIT